MTTERVAATDTVTALRVEHLSHSYDGAPALHDVNFKVATNEIVAIVGASGCGKSTLLRICAGLLTPTRGSTVTESTKPSIVFQEPALLPWRRVVDNARLFAAPDAHEHVERLLHMSGLAEHANKWPYQLSGGMKMRLSLVRALATMPDLLLLDEPFGSLDHITRQRLHDELASLHASFGFAAVLVTHAIDEAVYLADRVLVMSPAPGRIVGEFVVTFPRTRTDSLRYTPEFAALCGGVAACLKAHQ